MILGWAETLEAYSAMHSISLQLHVMTLFIYSIVVVVVPSRSRFVVRLSGATGPKSERRGPVDTYSAGDARLIGSYANDSMSDCHWRFAFCS